MENVRPILSICIPTNGVVEWVKPTLDSIYNQNVDYQLFEVVITDNGENSKLENILTDYSYPNLRYEKNNDKGFLNLVTCLQKGEGLFCKMLNHRMMLKSGMLQEMIEVINKYKNTKPVLYFLNGSIPYMSEFVYCKDFDQFVYELSYWLSWSAGIGFWDIDKNKLTEIEPNEMFPNASLIFEHRQDSEYVIWNGVYGQMQDESGKGGYDLFHTFAVVLNDIVKNLYERGRISHRTFAHTKKKIFEFLCILYRGEVIESQSSTYAFIIKDIKQSVKVHYGLNGYYWMVVRQHLSSFKHKLFD